MYCHAWDDVARDTVLFFHSLRLPIPNQCCQQRIAIVMDHWDIAGADPGPSIRGALE